MKATLKKYVIKDNKLTLTFSSWIFTRDEVLDLTNSEDFEKMQLLVVLVERELEKTEGDLAFEYEGYNIQVGRSLAKKCISDCYSLVNG